MFHNDNAVWASAGLSQVFWFKESGRNVPILAIETLSGVKMAGLKPASLRWQNQSIFATFVSLDGQEFEINTRLHDGLLNFCAGLLRERKRQAEAKRASARKADKAKIISFAKREQRAA